MQFNSADNGEQWSAYSGETVTLDGARTGGININGGSNIGFNGFTFQNLGGSGIYVSVGNNLSITRNTFSGCNQACIAGGGITNSTISDNTMNGQSDPTAWTIHMWSGSSNNQITHNLIQNTQGGGISFAADVIGPAMNNNVVDRNILQNIATNAMDSGAIYIFDRSHSSFGNRITNNLIKNVGNGTGYATNWTKAIYLDDQTSNVMVSGNICKNCGNWAWCIHGGDHNTLVNNIWDISAGGNPLGLYQATDSALHLTAYGMGNNVFQKNIVYFSGPVPSNLYQVNTTPSEALPATSQNLYYAANGARVPNGEVIIDSNPVYADPQFAQPSAANYSMPSSSPAYTQIGFQPLVTDQGPTGAAPPSGGGGGVPVSPPATGGGPIANGTYTIRNVGSGLVLDDPGNAPPGAQVIQYYQNSPISGNQRWLVSWDSASNGYKLINQTSGGALTDVNSALFENAPNGDATQLWTISSGSGAYVLRNVATGRVIDNPNFNPNVVGIITWQANGGSNQGWLFQ